MRSLTNRDVSIISGGTVHAVVHTDAESLTRSIREGDAITSFVDGVRLTEQCIAFTLGMVIGVPYSIISLPVKTAATPFMSAYSYFMG